MAVPETPMDQNHGTIGREHNVGPSGQVLCVETVAKPPGVQAPAQQKLGPGIFPADPAHVEPALLGGQDVHFGPLRRWRQRQ